MKSGNVVVIADMHYSKPLTRNQPRYTLLSRIRALASERGGRVPAIALTALARAEDRRRALHAGYQVHLPKPVDAAELAAVIASLASAGTEVSI